MKTIALICTLAMSGCASQDYAQYAKSAEASSVARSKALSDIAASGDSAAKVAAVMALAMGAGNGTLAAPASNAALQWAQVLVPGLTQVAGIRYQYLSQQTASNNAASVAISTNSTMQGIAGRIQAPGAVTTTTDRHDTVTTLSGTGALGGSYSTDRHDVTSPPPVVITPVVQVVPTVITPVAGDVP